MGGALRTVTTCNEAVPTLLAASRASAVSVCEPSATVVVSQITLYGAAVTSLPRFMPSTLNWTPTTPTLSVAVACTSNEPATVPETRFVISTTGGVVSPADANVWML